jgi:CRP-like cAMP-binding protein
VAIIPHTRLRRITNEFPFLARVLWLTTLIGSSVHREWMTRIGRRSAKQRVAHVLCEMAARLRAVGMLNDNSYELPMTQAELADAVGVSSVHMNRVLQDLRHDGLITSHAHTVTINDREQLCKVAQFSPDYLHVRLHVDRD